MVRATASATMITATRATKQLWQKEQGAWGSSLRPRLQWQWCPQTIAATVGAGNGCRSEGSARADNN